MPIPYASPSSACVLDQLDTLRDTLAVRGHGVVGERAWRTGQAISPANLDNCVGLLPAVCREVQQAIASLPADRS